MKNFDYKKSLGQNFLMDKNIIHKISDSIKPNENDLIVEIGPGAGALTKEILESIESDRLKIVFNDFLKVNLKEYIDETKYKNIYFVGNLPYYITTAIINKIIDESNPHEITVMVQKEVGDRFMSKPNSRDYGSLSVFLQYNFDVTKVVNVNKRCFEPVPKVDSVVVKLSKNKKFKAENEEKFYKLVKSSFTQKRKNLRNNLRNYDLEKIEKVLNKYDKDLTARAESLSIEEFVDISNNL